MLWAKEQRRERGNLPGKRNSEELMTIFQEILDRKNKIGGHAELSTRKTEQWTTNCS